MAGLWGRGVGPLAPHLVAGTVSKKVLVTRVINAVGGRHGKARLAFFCQSEDTAGLSLQQSLAGTGPLRFCGCDC